MGKAVAVVCAVALLFGPAATMLTIGIVLNPGAPGACHAVGVAGTQPEAQPTESGREPGGTDSGRQGTGRKLGELPVLKGHLEQPSPTAIGSVTTANANLKFPRTTPRALRMIVKADRPDFITLNEVGRVDDRVLERAVNGYEAYRDPVEVGPAGGRQSVGNALMWRSDRWWMLDGGRVKIVDKDQTYYRGRRVSWERYATWGLFARVSDGATIAVVATHHMTNVRKQPRQWGNPPLSRVQQYALGMDILTRLAARLAPFGPVLLGGDMNSHPGDGDHAAAPRMHAAGFRHTKDRGVIYQFFPATAEVLDHRQLRVPSDHPVNITSLSLRANGSTIHGVAGTPVGCSPCPVLDGTGESAATSPSSYSLGPVSDRLRHLVELLAPMFGIRSVGGYRESARDPGGHPSGNAADFMVPSDRSGWANDEGRRRGDALARYAQVHAHQLGVDYIIWWQRIWSVGRAAEGWRPMEDRGSHNENHRNHVHINVVPGAGGRHVSTSAASLPATVCR